ncbi:mandelate racemase/muconate lactonizing enzyme family protein [Aquimonas voraii]|uniref:L-alanine-DL-glutamate epimerase n=1 Tax=Aquimonas voraii TaxID=265719 RepID=A0A1G6VJB9_9GAMM|nr:mandelate racemase/muconate lactonizing enzyme family protein [Aquimonas voraii]SDD53624.1 L-alanine-DL-glutamate epimerase [Aquimonas voraii]
MRIAQIDLWHVGIPTPAPFYPSWIPGFPQTENRFTLVRLRTESGIEGWSAGPAMGRERAGLGDLLGPYLLGERADDILSIHQRIREMGYLGWRLGWLEAACWDIVGKARGKPVYELLGGHGGKVKLYASTGEVKKGPERIREVEARMKEGFEAVKLRVHDWTLEEDVAQIRETRKGVGDDVVLGVDANQAWRVAVVADAPRWDFERALAFCREAEALSFRWVEEPLAMDDYEGIARLSAAVDIHIAGGELNNQGLPEFKLMLEKGCYDWYQPDAVFTGGIAGTWQIIKRITAAGRKYSPHSWTNGIGFAINLQLHAASPSREQTWLEYPYNPPSWVPEVRDGLLREPWSHERGLLTLPTRPGLGFEIDARALRRYGKHFFKATRTRMAVHAVLDKGLRTAREIGAVRDARLRARHTELERLIASGLDPALAALE